METIRSRLPLRNRQEQDLESRVIRRHETDLIMITGLAVDLPMQSLGPEARETEGGVRIEAESDEVHVQSTSWLSSQLGPTTSALAARTRSASSRSAVTTITSR